MHQLSNLAWPEDPFGTGQLWRKERRFLSGIATHITASSKRLDSYACVYVGVPPMKDRPRRIDHETFTFGFKAACGASSDSMKLAESLDVALLQVARHSVFVAGHDLKEQCAFLEAAIGQSRGVRALARLLSEDRSVDERPLVHDTATAAAYALRTQIRDGCERPRIVLRAEGISEFAEDRRDECDPGQPVRGCLNEALIASLAAAADIGLVSWDGEVVIQRLVELNAWDQFAAIGG